MLTEVGFTTCAACFSGNNIRLTTYGRVMQLRLHILTFKHGVQFVAHTELCIFFIYREKCVISFVCESETSENEGVFVPLHNVEGASETFQLHGRTIVFDHLPVSNHGTTII